MAGWGFKKGVSSFLPFPHTKADNKDKIAQNLFRRIYTESKNVPLPVFRFHISRAFVVSAAGYISRERDLRQVCLANEEVCSS